MDLTDEQIDALAEGELDLHVTRHVMGLQVHDTDAGGEFNPAAGDCLLYRDKDGRPGHLYRVRANGIDDDRWSPSTRWDDMGDVLAALLASTHVELGTNDAGWYANVGGRYGHAPHLPLAVARAVLRWARDRGAESVRRHGDAAGAMTEVR